MRLLSDAVEYGVRSVIWLAQQPDKTCKVREIAEGIRAAPGYLVKVLQALAKAGLISAQRGSQGGFRLERDPAHLTVLEVISAIDPIERIRKCPLGLESHADSLCPMHRQVDDALALIERGFAQTTVADLLKSRASSRPCTALRVAMPTIGAKTGA
jgi:Rrf2 family protein